MTNKTIPHLNDKTMKYLTFAQSKRQHEYLKLPGKFKTRLPQEIVFPDMDSGRADEFYYTDEGLLIDLEEESEYIIEKTLKKFSKYLIYGCYWYREGKPYIAVICHKNPKKFQEYYEYGPSVIIKIHYIYFSQDELWKKYEKIINKVKQKIELSDREALDMAFICKFISKKHAPLVIESLSKIFNEAIIKDKVLKIDVKVILSGMILKYVKSTINKIN